MTIPTIGFNVENLHIWGLKLTVWDVGGQARIRPLWRHYTTKTDGSLRDSIAFSCFSFIKASLRTAEWFCFPI